LTPDLMRRFKSAAREVAGPYVASILVRFTKVS
jgi:hypothetical protein